MKRELNIAKIEQVVKDLCIKANTVLRDDVMEALKGSWISEEDGSLTKRMLKVLLDNADIARDKVLPICQDTGLVTVFLDIGEEVVFQGGNVIEAVNEGVRKSYTEAGFRMSVVDDPIIRKNTGTNTPASVTMDMVTGKRVTISVIPKGFGCENKSRAIMLNPTSPTDEIVDFCVNTLKKAGPDACPPFILGIGIGGSLEKCAILAKKALLRDIRINNSKSHLAELEVSIRERANSSGIGVMGIGGKNTVLGVNIESAATHIAGLPLVVNLSCHALRSASATV